MLANSAGNILNSIPVDVGGANLVVANGATIILAAAQGYVTVTQNQSANILGTTGAIGDILTEVVIVPGNTSPANVTLLDLAASIPLFVGGANALVDTKPIIIPLQMKSKNGAWKVTTGANVSVIAVGSFT